jgi:hypothetical protein
VRQASQPAAGPSAYQTFFACKLQLTYALDALVCVAGKQLWNILAGAVLVK